MVRLRFYRQVSRQLVGLCAVLCLIPGPSIAAPDAELGEMFSDIEDRAGPGSAPDQESFDADVVELDHPVTDLLDVHQKRKFSGWGAYTREFKDLCAAVAADGRDAQLKLITDRYMEREASCPACYPLMKILSRTCSLKKIPKSKKEKKKTGEPEVEVQDTATPPSEATVKAVILQREPNLQVELFIQALLERLSDDEPRRDEGMIALKQLSTRLVSASYQQQPGERDYFTAVQGVMNEYLDQQQQFRENQAEKVQVEDGIHVTEKPEDSVDELFDYN